MKTISVLSSKVDALERAQQWMKVVLGVFGFLAPVILGLLIFLAQEGIRSYSAKLVSTTSDLSVPASTSQPAVAPTPTQVPASKSPK